MPHGRAIFLCPEGGGNMGVKVTFNDNSAQVLSQLDANKKAALLALGTKAAGLIVEQMETGYHTPHKNRPHGKKYINAFGQKLKNDAFVGSDGGAHTAIREISPTAKPAMVSVR